MQHAILYGEYELSIDDKNRLLVPSDVRKSLDPQRDGDGYFLIIGMNRKPWLYPERYYEWLVSQIQPEMSPDEDIQAYDEINFAMASKVSVDKQGRILIPDKTLRRGQIEGKELTLLGKRDHLEIWNRGEWEARHGALLTKMSEVALRVRQQRKPSAPPQP